MYCGNHDLVRCKSCMELTHRSCTDVHLLPDNINAIFKKTDVDKTTITVKKTLKQLEKIINTRMTLLKNLEESKAEAIIAIKQFRKEMELILEKLEKGSVKEVEEEYRKTESMLEEEKKKAENEVENIKQADTDMRQVEGNNAQTFVNMKVAQDSLTNANDVISSLKTPTDVKITFQVNANVHDFLHQLNYLGRVKICSSTTLKPRARVYSIKETSDMNIRLSQDTNVCHVLGCCLTETGMLLLADNINKKLKRVYVTNLSVIDQCEFPGYPRLVCAANEQEAAVTFPNNTIQFVSLGSQLTPTRQFTLNHDCLGIACRDDKMYITGNNQCLYICDMTGNLLQTVSQDSFGNPLFTSSRQIVSSDSGDFFVVDWNNRMIAVDIQGKHINTFTDSNLAEASGVDTDSRGNVFVCGYRSNNIVQRGQDGSKKGVLATASDGLVNPLSICFDPNRCILFVTQANSDKVKVFKLK